MIVFDLRCGGGHVFEAWFASTGAYDEQRAAGRLSCPLCDDRTIEKAVMAPAVGAKGNRDEPGPRAAAAKRALAALAAAQTEALSGSRWVGRAFAREARAIHAGERAGEAIHGQASVAEAKALIDDGIAVAPLPLPVVPPDAVN